MAGDRYIFMSRLAGGSASTSLPPNLSISIWKPGPLRLWPHGLAPLPSVVWSLFHLFHIFANRSYCVAIVKDGEKVVHRCFVFPRYIRFPFMENNDVQLGDLYTDPAYRGLGIAPATMREIVKNPILVSHKTRVWYLVEEENLSSIKAAEKAGFSIFALGERYSRFGFRIFGYFGFDNRCQDN